MRRSRTRPSGAYRSSSSYLSPSLNGTVRTGADGRFAMTNVGPGDYTITARSWPTGGAAGVSMWAQVDVTVGSSDIANLALPLRPRRRRDRSRAVRRCQRGPGTGASGCAPAVGA